MSRLETGFDIGANINKLAMRIGKVVKKYEEQFNKIQDLEIENGGIKMENTVASKYNPNYKMHVLVKYECLECERSFILSKKQVDDLEGIDVSCPYCGNYNVEDTVIMDDPDSIEDLGCMGIGHIEKEQKKEEHSMVVVKKVYIYNPGGGDSRLVVSDKDVINGAGDYDFEEATLMIKGETMRKWAAEQKFIDSQEEGYEIVDDRY